MDIQIRKQLEQLEYIKDKLEYIEYSESLQCYVEKLNGIPTGVAAWVNGAFYGFEQAAKAQAVPEGLVLVSQKESNREAFELVVANKLQNSLYHSVFFNEATGWYDCADDAPAGVQVFCCDLNSDFRIWKAAKAQAVPGWISVEDSLPPVDETVLVCWDYAADIEPEKEYLTLDEDYNEYWPNCQDEPPTHWMPIPQPPKAQEQKG